MELHFFTISLDSCFYFFTFLSTFLLLGNPNLVPRAFPRGKFCFREKPWRRGWASPSFAFSFATLEKRGKLGRVNFRKEFWVFFQNWPIADRRVPSNAPGNNCGTHFCSSFPLVSKVANHLFQRNIWPKFSCHVSDIFLLLIYLQQEASRPKIARLRSKVAQGH